MQRNRSSYAGKTGISWSGTSKLIECTTTTVRSTSPIERNVTVGQNCRNVAWSSANDGFATGGRYSRNDARC